jgi:glycine/serine hydroxymethyltransferase
MQAMTTRGVNEEDTKHIARFIHEAIQNRSDDEKLKVIRAEVVECCSHFPIPSISIN